MKRDYLNRMKSSCVGLTSSVLSSRTSIIGSPRGSTSQYDLIDKEQECMKLLSEVRYNLNQKIERPGSWVEHTFELCREDIKVSKAQITSVEEFKRSMLQVFKVPPQCNTTGKIYLPIEHAVGTVHDLAAMCRGQGNCFDKAKESPLDSCPYDQLLSKTATIISYDTLKNGFVDYSILPVYSTLNNFFSIEYQPHKQQS